MAEAHQKIAVILSEHSDVYSGISANNVVNHCIGTIHIYAFVVIGIPTALRTALMSCLSAPKLWQMSFPPRHASYNLMRPSGSKVKHIFSKK